MSDTENMTDIEKNTFQDRLRILSDALNRQYGSEVYAFDYDDQFVYFHAWVEGGQLTLRLAYTVSDTVNIEFIGNPQEVFMLTDAKVKGEVDESRDDEERQAPTISQRLSDFLDRNFNGSARDTIRPVIKQFDEEQMIAIEPLYIAVGEVDGHGDTIDSIEEMEHLVKSFNEANEKGILQSSLFHKHKTNAFSVIKAWVNECECMIGDHIIPEGQPIVKIQFNNKKAWEMRKEGRFGGVSIGARAVEVEELEQ